MLLDLLDEEGIEYQVGPIGTCVQGTWEEVMPLVERCHRLVAASHGRVLTTITIDDRKAGEHSLAGAVAAAESGTGEAVEQRDAGIASDIA